MGVDTQLMVARSHGAEQALQGFLTATLEGAQFDPRFGVATWVFRDSGGELLVSDSMSQARSAHQRRHSPGVHLLEILNAMGSK